MSLVHDIQRAWQLKCLMCGREDTVVTEYAGVAAQRFHDRGWRSINDKTLCACCSESGCGDMSKEWPARCSGCQVNPDKLKWPG